MTDRELLERAAKAVGIEPVDFSNEQWGKYWTRDGYWNPLTDDGDAFRLAVKLQFTVAPFHVETPDGATFRIEDGYMFSATRRAIVRAAAALAE